MKTYNIYTSIIEDLDALSFEELHYMYNNAEFMNYTLESGHIGYALSLLYHYEKNKDTKHLSYVKRIIFKDLYLNNNISLYYGISGLILAQLYYYYITDDSSILDNISSNIEKVMSSVKVMPKKHFINLNFKDGLSGIIYLYTILQYSNEKSIFENILNEINRYIHQLLKAESDNDENNDISLVHSIIAKNTSKENMLLLDDSSKHIRNFSSGINNYRESKTIEMFSHILDLASKRQLFIKLDKNSLCKNIIEQYFPRTVESNGCDYNYAVHYSSNSIETVQNFCHSFIWQDEISESLFCFEKKKFLYELELRDLPITELIRRNNDEVRINIEHLCLNDDEFLRQYFKCSADIRLIETHNYKTLEIEEDILEASKYIVALKPRTVPFNELHISECCLEDSFRLIVNFNKMEEPISGQDLVEIAYEQDESIEYNIVKDFVVTTLRKLVLYRLLTIEKCGNRKAIIE